MGGVDGEILPRAIQKIKPLSPEAFKDTIERIADNYVMYSSWFKEA